MTSDQEGPSAQTGRRWRRPAAAALGLAALALMELSLRLFGVAPDGTLPRELFRRPAKAFVRDGPVYKTGDQYILGQTFAAVKPAGTMRVFIAGGSVAMGFPLEDSLGPKQLLRTALDALEPGRAHEVINAAGFGFSSRDVRRVVEEAVDYQPDLVIVMTGHNEFLERRFIPGDAAGISRTRVLLSRLRLYRVLEGLAAFGRDADKQRWDPHVVSAGERQLVEIDFQRNLNAIADACRDKNILLVLAALPANVQDFRPYGPSPDAAVAYQRGVEALDSGDVPAAERAFEDARDLDSMPVRITGNLADTIRAVAKQRDLTLADVDATFASLREGLRHRDRDYFLDHCHLNFEGQKVLVTELVIAGFRANVFPAMEYWEDTINHAWEDYADSIPRKRMADAYYKTAYETGVNMDRPHRGLDHARRALELDPGHAKAQMLLERLTAAAEGRPHLTGD